MSAPLESRADAPHASDESQDTRPAKKSRKPRPCYSCNECRRLKMKCDRQVPCANCVRRGRIAFCKKSRLFVHTNDPSQRVSETRHGTKPVAMNEHGQENIASGPASLTADPSVNETGHPTGLSQENFAWATHNPGTQVHAETVHDANNCSVNASDLDALGGTTHDAAQDGSYGTLVLSGGGRSKYLGPTAGSEWLRDSENQDASNSPTMVTTRAPSPAVPYDHRSVQRRGSAAGRFSGSFPFGHTVHTVSIRDLLLRLPPREEAHELVNCYYRYCAWHHDVAPRDRFEKTFDRVYDFSNGDSRRFNAQELALVFIVLAQGNLFNIEISADLTVSEELLYLSEVAMMKGDFLSNNTIAGVQTLHLMAHLHLNWDQGSRGDRAWPVWGLVMRLIQAMGMHRDGARWNLPREVVEERRKVFWECNAADVFQAHCFSRPSAINPEHCDTAFPFEAPGTHGEKGYFTLRFELSQISAEILNMAMKVQRPSYSTVLGLHAKLTEFERNVPFGLRSRTAFSSMPSQYSTTEDVLKASPEPSRTSVAVTFQRMNLAFNISETFINLHRPYYAKVLYSPHDEPTRSMCATSFLTIIERCAIIIALVGDVQAGFPNVSTRQWNLWYHVFGSALCLGTLVLSDPGNVMSPFALTQIDAAIALFASLLAQGGGTPRYRANLEWLHKLRARALVSLQTVSAGPTPDNPADGNGNSIGSGQDEELVGWRTRLIERAGRSQYKSRTIRLSESPSNSIVPVDDLIRPSHLYDHGAWNQGNGALLSDPPPIPRPQALSTNDLLTGFWEPMLLQDAFDVSDSQSEILRSLNPTWWED